MRARALLAIALAGLPLAQAAANCAWPTNIEAFTDALHPIEGADSLRAQMPGTRIQIHRIDTKAEFDAKLSQGLPPDPQAAASIVKERLAGIRPADAEAALQGALNSAVLMSGYGLSRIPAVVFDGHAAVVGETSLRRALDVYCRRSS